MTKGVPATLTQIEVKTSVSTAVVSPHVEKRVTVGSIALRENTEVVLPFSGHIHPHGKGVGFVLVSRQVV